MKSPEQLLQAIYLAGFELETLERFPRAIAVRRGECLVLFETSGEELRMLGQPGWRLGEAIGVLVERDGQQYFQSKNELLEATPERLTELEQFTRELTQLLQAES